DRGQFLQIERIFRGVGIRSGSIVGRCGGRLLPDLRLVALLLLALFLLALLAFLLLALLAFLLLATFEFGFFALTALLLFALLLLLGALPLLGGSFAGRFDLFGEDLFGAERFVVVCGFRLDLFRRCRRGNIDLVGQR